MPHWKLSQQRRVDGQNGKKRENDGSKGEQRRPCWSNTASKNQETKKLQPPVLVMSVYGVDMDVIGSCSLIMNYPANSPSLIPGSPLLPNQHYLSAPLAQGCSRGHSDLIPTVSSWSQYHSFHFLFSGPELWKYRNSSAPTVIGRARDRHFHFEREKSERRKEWQVPGKSKT